MVESKRWIVTYTKHLRQKRKVYQDGLLELHCPSNKVLLYDDSGKLLDSRFLKKDDLIECGATIAFETHIVDIVDLDETYKPLQDMKVSGSDAKLNVKSETYHQASRNSFLGNKTIDLETSNGLQYPSNPSPTAAREWDVLYTTQITQKAKRYHDGILKLVSCGSHTNQLILLKEDGTTLSSKFQKLAECLSIGNTYEMPNYLVEICEERNILEEDKNSSHCSINKDSLPSSTRANLKGIGVSKCNISDKVVIRSPGVSKIAKNVVAVNSKPSRDAFQILSFLKRPPQDDERLADQTCPSQSLSLVHSDLHCSGGGSSKSVTSPEIPSIDTTKSVYPSCEGEFLIDNCSASSSVLYGEEACKTLVTNLGVDATEKDFQDIETSRRGSENTDTGCTSLNNSDLHITEPGIDEKCNQLHPDNIHSGKEGREGFHSSAASSLSCGMSFPSTNCRASDSMISMGKTTDVDDYPSFDLAFEL